MTPPSGGPGRELKIDVSENRNATFYWLTGIPPDGEYHFIEYSAYQSALAKVESLEKLANTFKDEVRKVLPRAPSMDGKESWTQCQRMVDRAISEFEDAIRAGREKGEKK